MNSRGELTVDEVAALRVGDRVAWMSGRHEREVSTATVIRQTPSQLVMKLDGRDYEQRAWRTGRRAGDLVGDHYTHLRSINAPEIVKTRAFAMAKAALHLPVPQHGPKNLGEAMTAINASVNQLLTARQKISDLLESIPTTKDK